jgi:hypothetical protein
LIDVKLKPWAILSSIIAYCHKHENYEDEWWKGRSKSKSKTWNKRTKTKTQKLKLRTWSMQDQSTNKIFITIKKKHKYENNRTKLYFRFMLNKLKITWRTLPLFIPLWGSSKKLHHVKMVFVTHIGKPWIMHALNMFHQMVWICPKHYKIHLILRHMYMFVNWTLHPLHVPKCFWIRLNLLKSCCN